MQIRFASFQQETLSAEGRPQQPNNNYVNISVVQIEALPKGREGFYQQQVNGHTLPRLAFHKSSLLLECLIVDNIQVSCLN